MKIKKMVLMGCVLLACVSVFAAPVEVATYQKLEADAREPVLMLGDSMMRLLSRAMEKALKKEGIEASSYTSLGSGLARLDALDWFAKIEEMMTERKPATVVITLGANDRQPLKDASGNVFQFGTDAWRAEYGSRIGRAMDALIQHGAKRVVWLCLPDMKEHIQQTFAEMANGLYAEQVAVGTRKDQVVLFDTRATVSRVPGKYSAYMMSPRGEALTVRDQDGVHLTMVGARLVAETLVETFWGK